MLDDLRTRGTEVFRTDEQGTIVAVSDGKNITFNTEPSVSWLYGNSEEAVSTVEKTVITDTKEPQHDIKPSEEGITYVYNRNTGKFHYPNCSSVGDMKAKNRVDMNCSREELLKTYPNAKPCKRCNP